MSDIVLDSAAGPMVRVAGRELVYLGGTGYLGMNHHPAVLEATGRGLTRWGLSSSASRTTSGSAAPHVELERRLERLLGVDSVALTASAYLGNAVRFQALRDELDVVVADALSHPSLIEAAILAGKPVERFEHRDAGHARELLKRARDAGRRPVLATDAVFPTSGLLAPLDDYAAITEELGLKLDAALHIDDAHGFGVLGANGLGTPEELGVPHRAITMSATFSKALGCFGGFAAGGRALGERVAASGAYVGATPTPPAILEGVLAALDIVASGEQRARLRESASRVKSALREMGLEFPETPMPIAQFSLGDEATSRRISAGLVARGVLIPYIVYPGGPEGGFFRLAVSAAHEAPHLDRAIGALREVLGSSGGRAVE